MTMIRRCRGKRSMIQPCDGFVSYVASFGTQLCEHTDALSLRVSSWRRRTHEKYRRRHGIVERKATSLCCVVSATMCHTYGLRPPRASHYRCVSPPRPDGRISGHDASILQQLSKQIRRLGARIWRTRKFRPMSPLKLVRS